MCARLTVVYSHVGEEDGRVGAVGLDVLHGVPLVDADLVGGDLALVVADPGQEQTAGEVVMATSHLTRLVERLQSRPGRGSGEKWRGGERRGEKWRGGEWREMERGGIEKDERG